jgi:hypothetical protein
MPEGQKRTKCEAGDEQRVIGWSPCYAARTWASGSKGSPLPSHFKDFLFSVRGLNRGEFFVVRQNFSAISGLNQKRWSLPSIYKSHREFSPSNRSCTLYFSGYPSISSFSDHPCAAERFAEIGAAARQARTERAQRNRAEILPTIAKIQAAGATTLRQIAAELNALEIPASRGGEWSAVQVLRILADKQLTAGMASCSTGSPVGKLQSGVRLLAAGQIIIRGQSTNKDSDPYLFAPAASLLLPRPSTLPTSHPQVRPLRGHVGLSCAIGSLPGT